MGLSGGNLPQAVRDLQRTGNKQGEVQFAVARFRRRVCDEVLELIEWASQFGAGAAEELPLSPAAASSPLVIRFVDRYMQKSRNVLSGYDASEGALYVLFLAVLAAHPESPALFAVDNADQALNPRLARALMSKFCGWMLDSPTPRQALLTTHNPLVLDGLPLQDDRVRLFTVARALNGATVVQRVEVTEKLLELADQGWTLSRLWVMGHLGGVPDV